MSCSVHPMSDNDFVSRFMQHVFGLAIHSLSFRRSMSGAALAILLVGLCQVFHCPRCCSRFPSYFLIRLVGHKMFLHPAHIDLVDQCASSILVQPAVLSESSVPSGKAHPSSSCIPLSRCKQLIVCRRGRFHATLFGKTAMLSLERVSNCTNILYSDVVSKYFCMEQSLALSSRMEFPSYNFHLPSGLLL